MKNYPRTKSIRKRLGRRALILTMLLALLLIEIFTVTAVVVSQQVRTNEALEIHTRQLLEDAINEARENARAFLIPAENAALLTQGLFTTQLLDLDRTQELESYFLEQLKIVPQIDGLFYGDPRGQFLFTKRDQEKNGAQFVTKIITLENDTRQVYRIWRNEEYTELLREYDLTDTYDPRQRPWYQQAKTSKTSIWTDPYVFFTSQQPGLTVAAPIQDKANNLIGVIGVDVGLTVMSRFLAEQKIASLGGAVIVHQNGDVLAYPNPEKLSKATEDKLFRLAHLNELDTLTTDATRKLMRRHPDLATLDNIYFDKFNAGGDDFLSVFMPFLDQKKWPWIMGIYAPQKQFAESIREGQRQSIIIAIFVSALIILAAFVLGPRFMRPLTTLQQHAEQDPLTKLLNRRSFHELATHMLADAKQRHVPLSAMMLDIDKFKPINDTHGHQVGDEVIKAIARRLKRGLSDHDLLTRYGGEEFAVVLPVTDIAQARIIAERLRNLIANEPFLTAAGSIPITISLGVAEIDPSMQQIQDLLNSADQCLLTAKRTGRNRVVVAKEENPTA